MKKSFYLFIIFLLLVILLIVLILILFPPSGITTTNNAVKEPPAKLEVYFCPEEMCKEKLISLIDSSSDIKCAFYELNLFDVIDKLKAKNADVVIEDSTYKNGSGFHTGFSNALMHNKFCIFENKTVFTGSMNPTVNDNFYNNNNIIIVQSKTLAGNYLDEFKELRKDIYGKGDKIKNPLVYIGDTQIENYFCPDDNCKLHVITALKKANTSIYFMTFSFTDVDIGNLVFNKHYQGLDVKGIFDESQLSDYSRYEDLKDFSEIDKNKYKLHDKVFIIDNETVITGSFNPTNNANEYNDENILIIHDKAIAEKYVSEFLKLYRYDSSMPEKTSEIVVTKVLYNPSGADEGNEIVELKNLAKEDINLEYYSLGDNKSSMKLSGILMAGDSTTVKPKFSLKNSNGLLFLKHNSVIVDYVYWDGIWSIKAKENSFLIRSNTAVISENSWAT
jgi:hypothetical protein